MDQDTEDIGAFRVDKWIRHGETGYGHDKETAERVYIKTEKASKLIEWEASTLRKLVGGIGMPTLRWFGEVDDQKVLVTDGFGLFLEDLFDRCSRHFSVYSLTLLADHMLSRLEWMHTRHVSHGNLTPFSFAIGDMSWQMPQLILADLGNADPSCSSNQKDLEAVGNILFYLSSGCKSWEDFQEQDITDQKFSAPLMSYIATISETKLQPTDYGRLREIFRNTCQLPPTMALINDLVKPKENGPNLKCLATASTGDLFEILASKLSAIGRNSANLRTPWAQEQGVYLLRCLNDILAIYTVLLVRDRPSKTRTSHLMAAYHLPNRLWMDLRWYLSVAQNAPTPFQKAIILNVYKYVGLMLEMVPIYEAYWMNHLTDFACILMDQDSSPSKAWRSVWIYWRDSAEVLGKQNVL